MTSLVVPVTGGDSEAPFWRAEEIRRDFRTAERVGNFLEWADREMESETFRETLARKYFMDETAVTGLIQYLHSQKRHTKSPLPHRRHVLIEYTRQLGDGRQSQHVFLHGIWGGRVNTPMALVLAAVWEDVYGSKLEIIPTNDGIALVVPHDASLKDLLLSIPSRDIDALLRRKVEGSGLFAARFRENAARGAVASARIIQEKGSTMAEPPSLAETPGNRLALSRFPDSSGDMALVHERRVRCRIAAPRTRRTIGGRNRSHRSQHGYALPIRVWPALAANQRFHVSRAMFRQAVPICGRTCCGNSSSHPSCARKSRKKR